MISGERLCEGDWVLKLVRRGPERHCHLCQEYMQRLACAQFPCRMSLALRARQTILRTYRCDLPVATCIWTRWVGSRISLPSLDKTSACKSLEILLLVESSVNLFYYSPLLLTFSDQWRVSRWQPFGLHEMSPPSRPIEDAPFEIRSSLLAKWSESIWNC